MKIRPLLYLLSLALLLTAGCQDTGTQTTDGGPASPPNGDGTGLTESILNRSSHKSEFQSTLTDILAPGSKAPEIDLAAVLHGPDIRPFSGDQVIVVEFWATWCGPCLANMPHLSALQQQYGPTVQFIAVTPEDEELVTAFLSQEVKDDQTWGDILSYTIGLDRNQKTYANFMHAAQQQGIPCAFVIDKTGLIAWIGHPARIDEPLAKIVTGTWSIDSARQQYLSAVAPEVSKVSIPTRPSLEPGMAAPPVKLASVLQGASFSGIFEKGRPYVVEFWATWCEPCEISMPRVSGLQAKYGDSVQIVSVTAEGRTTVKKFLGRNKNGNKNGNIWSDLLKQSIALDDNRITNANYMEAAGQQGNLPCAFIVNRDGNIAWIGNSQEVDRPLSQIIDGTFDIEQSTDMFRAKYDVKSAIAQGDLDSALGMLAELSESYPKNRQIWMMQLELLLSMGRVVEYYETAELVVVANPEDFVLLNTIAWEIAAGHTGDNRDLNLAMKAAMLASEATSHSNAMILDTVARVHYENGDFSQAVEWQSMAVKYERRTRGPSELAKTLSLYQSKVAGAASASDDADSQG